jgi:hypothetical protein
MVRRRYAWLGFVALGVVLGVALAVVSHRCTQAMEEAIEGGKSLRFIGAVEGVVKRIESYRSEHGQYPIVCTMDDLLPVIDVREWDEGYFYCSNGTDYILLHKPFGPGPCGGLHCGYVHVSGEWVLWPDAATGRLRDRGSI